jgi:hypothetical protein
MSSLVPYGLQKVSVVYPSVGSGGTYADNTIHWHNASRALEVEADYSLDGAAWTTFLSAPICTSTTHTVSHPNAAIYYRVRNLLNTGEWSNYTDELTWSLWVDTMAEAVTMTEGYVSSGGTGGGATAFTDSWAETVTMTDAWTDALVSATNIAYFIGTAAGAVHKYGSTWHGDNGTAITARWESKDINFNDQHPQLIGKNKTVDRVWLKYLDRDTVTVNVSLSADHGATWTTVSRSLGTGTGYPKESNFDFRKTGRMFRIRVEEASANKDFLWTGIEVEFGTAGDYFELS